MHKPQSELKRSYDAMQDALADFIDICVKWERTNEDAADFCEICEMRDDARDVLYLAVDNHIRVQSKCFQQSS